jgi:hypothetical protein
VIPVFVISLLQWFSNWGPIVFIRDSKYGMPAVQSFHLMGLAVFLATTVALNLRLAGIGMRDLSFVSLARQLRPWASGALTLLILSGILIFLGTPPKYLGSNPFRLKMALLSLAILFHFAVLRRLARSEPESRTRLVNVILAGLSLTLWFSVGWAGRAIAFVP